MNNKQIQEMLTIRGWAKWLQYVRKNNIKNEGGLWPNYDYHEFYLGLEKEDCVEHKSEGGGYTSRSEPVVPCDVPEGHDCGGQMELQPYDHISERREASKDIEALPQPGDGPPNI